MATWYNSQMHGEEKRFCIQFETDNYGYFKLVETACRCAIDRANEALAERKENEDVR